ncbi:MAG TPA: hypothetical protein ENG51_00450 [Deltaproteobacteria bacterium]|nr:hypothetical protein [Deltaproteobacteria bacterium]
MALKFGKGNNKGGFLGGLFGTKKADYYPYGLTGKLSEDFCPSDFDRPCITVCFNDKCTRGCANVRDALNEAIEENNLAVKVGLMKTACSGNCSDGPFVGFPKKKIFYSKVTPDMAGGILLETLMRGRVIFDLLHISPYRSYRSDVLFDRDDEYLIAIDESICMVCLCDYFLRWDEGVSCGKCVPCRQGNIRLRKLLNRIMAGEGEKGDIEELKAICDAMRLAAYCDFAKSTSMPLLLALKHYEKEFIDHIEKKGCSGGSRAESEGSGDEKSEGEAAAA